MIYSEIDLPVTHTGPSPGHRVLPLGLVAPHEVAKTLGSSCPSRVSGSPLYSDMYSTPVMEEDPWMRSNVSKRKSRTVCKIDTLLYASFAVTRNLGGC